ncbi:MAG: phosphoribosylformylglycinamidine cyclo-ligase [Thermoplasmatales archaeon]
MPTYKESGVDFDTVGAFRDSIIAGLTYKGKKYRRAAKIGHYSGLVSFNDGYIAVHTDNVGTKTILALKYHYFEEIGYDLVGMNVNDIVCIGAEPIAMVDYIAGSVLDRKMGSAIGKSIDRASREAGVAVVGGETASVPDLVSGIDISGTVVGFVGKRRVINGNRIKAGDTIVGLPSNGFHSNGFSLLRKIYEGKDDALNLRIKGVPLWKRLLTGTKIYSSPILALLEDLEIHGISHVTGGGVRNLSRLKKVKYQLVYPEIPYVFRKVMEDGNISTKEAFQTFNMGIGMFIILPKKEVRDALDRLENVGPEVVGEVKEGEGIEISNLGLRYKGYY